MVVLHPDDVSAGPKDARREKKKGTRPELFQATPLDSMREWLEDALHKLPDFEVRRMFGGAGIYAEGTMFGILSAGRVFLKTDLVTRAAFVEREMAAFSPRKGTVLKSYYQLPPDVVEDERELLDWCRRALRVAVALSAR